MAQLRQFKTGEMYRTRSVCDHDCIFIYTVISRSAKMITIKNQSGKIIRKGVKPDYDGIAEICFPEGNYSMAPIIRAV